MQISCSTTAPVNSCTVMTHVYIAELCEDLQRDCCIVSSILYDSAEVHLHVLIVLLSSFFWRNETYSDVRFGGWEIW